VEGTVEGIVGQPCLEASVESAAEAVVGNVEGTVAELGV
jgi:hypothetical protein